LLFAVRGPKLVKPRDLIKNWKLKVGDQVVVLSGKDKEKTGKILATDWRRNMVKVSGCNLRRVQHPQTGEDVMIEKKIHYSNCNLVDPVTGTGTRVSVKTNDSGEQIRISTKSGSIIPWPDKKWSFRKREAMDGPKDTPPEIA